MDGFDYQMVKDFAGSTENMQRLSDVVDTILSCDRCELANTRTLAVPGEGDANAVVIFVGEGPGYAEDQQGRPFVGKSGQYLTEVMQSVGINREDVFITNVVKCRPPENRDPLQQELEACADYLDQQIALINPRIIVTLGRFSMRRWFPNGSITRIHGQVRNIGRGRIALAMFHPAAALRNPQWQEAFTQDMRKLPPLIERAMKADRLAEAGDALPAGAPHPGDPDFVQEDQMDEIQNQQDVSRPVDSTDEDDTEQLSLW